MNRRTKPQPQFGFVIEITLRNQEGTVRYEQAHCTGDNYDVITDIASHQARFLIKDGYRIVEIRLSNFKFFPHNYFLFYKEEQ